jgi:hypothetical protein
LLAVPGRMLCAGRYLRVYRLAFSLLPAIRERAG